MDSISYKARDDFLQSRFATQLDQDVLEFIHGDPESCSEERFNQLALRTFERQYHTNKPYQAYCRRANVSPGAIARWAEIPAVSSFGFEKLLLASLGVEKTEETCLASRIFDLKNRSERMYLRKWDIELITAANHLWTKLFLFPDVERIKILLMVPMPKMARWMEMAVGLEQVRLKFGTSDSRFLISFAGLDIKTLVSALREAEKTQKPLALIGVAGALMQLLDACEREGIRFSLPRGSRICDVGRERGQFGEFSNEEYFRKCEQIMGVEKDLCVSVLWTCENSTNYFDNVLKNRFSGQKRDRCKEIPPWTRTTVVDTSQFKRLPRGEIGLLRHYDLTNRVLALAVQTDMLGFETEDGFEIVGRWSQRMGETGVAHSVGHPGGKAVTHVLAYLMGRKMSKVGKIYAGLK
jgi:hypothetical protein